MADSPDRHAFDVATSPALTNDEFRDVVRQIASADTLDGFLRALNTRFPETGSFGPSPASVPAAPVAPKAEPTAAAPRSAQLQRRPGDVAPTGSIAR
jgi:hypothetical protein